jgi:hypothetical protein
MDTGYYVLNQECIAIRKGSRIDVVLTCIVEALFLASVELCD